VPLRIDGDHSVEVKGANEPLQVFCIGAIAGQHNLALPSTRSQPQALMQPLEIHYAILLKGTQRQGSAQTAVITHLSEREAWLELTEEKLELFDNLVLTFPRLNGHVYGKVRENLKGRFRIVFNTTTPDLKQLILSLGPTLQEPSDQSPQV
jgi:hypothetical protein